MSLKFIFIVLSICLLALPSFAKEKSTNYRETPLGQCPTEDPLCHDMTEVPKTTASFEVLKLERVIDGDTIVANNRKIRIWGIDAPEKEHAGYLAASWLMQALLKEGKLTCKLIDIDRYQREVMHCLIDGLDVGGMMVKAGMAKDYTKYSGGYYKQEQDNAKAQKRGIWKLAAEH